LLDGKKTSSWEYTISTSLRKEIREGHEIYRRYLVAQLVGFARETGLSGSKSSGKLCASSTRVLLSQDSS
jgi:hypothetical protein